MKPAIIIGNRSRNTETMNKILAYALDAVAYCHHTHSTHALVTMCIIFIKIGFMVIDRKRAHALSVCRHTRRKNRFIFFFAVLTCCFVDRLKSATKRLTRAHHCHSLIPFVHDMHFTLARFRSYFVLTRKFPL